MQVVFIRHAAAEAEESIGDEGRKLTKEGTQQCKNLAAFLKAMRLDVRKVLASPILRAAETAAIIAHEFGGVGVEAVEYLTPPGDERRLHQRLADFFDTDVPAVAVVGHSPALDELLADIIADTRRVGLALTKAGVACVEMPVEDAPNGGVLKWLLTYEQVEALVKANARAPAHAH